MTHVIKSGKDSDCSASAVIWCVSIGTIRENEPAGRSLSYAYAIQRSGEGDGFADVVETADNVASPCRKPAR